MKLGRQMDSRQFEIYFAERVYLFGEETAVRAILTG